MQYAYSMQYAYKKYLCIHIPQIDHECLATLCQVLLNLQIF